MDNADLSQLPRPLREALLRAFESVIDLHDMLQAMAPMPATPKQVAEMIHKPHMEVQRILIAMEMLGTIYRPTKGYYSTMAPRRPRTWDGPARSMRPGSRASWRRAAAVRRPQRQH